MKARLIGSFGALAFSLVIAVSALDWAWIKVPLEQAATRAMGRAATVEGRVSVGLLPSPMAHAERVTLNGLGTVDRIDVALSPVALLSGRVEPRETRLVAARLGPFADVEAELGRDGEMKANARLPLSGQDGRITVDARLDGAAMDGRLRLTMGFGSAEGAFRLSGAGLTLPALLLSWGEWRGSLTLETGTLGPLVPLTAQLSASGFGLGLAALAEENRLKITGARLRLADGASADFTAELAHRDGALAVTGLRIVSGPHSVSGDLTIAPAPQPTVRGKLVVNKLPLAVDGVLDPGNGGMFTGQLSTPALSVEGIKLEDVQARLSARPGEVSVSSLTARLLGGNLSAAGTWTPAGFGIGARLSGGDLGRMGLGAGGIKASKGRIDGEARLTARGGDWAAWRSSLSGQGSLSARDGVVEGFDLAAMDKRLGQPQMLAGLLGAVQAGLGGGQTRFSSLTSTVSAVTGVVTAPDIKLVAEGGKADGHAVFDLPKDRVDARISLKPDTAGAPSLGLRIYGPTTATTKAVDVNALQHWLAERGLGKAAGGASGGLIESLLGARRR